LNKENKMDRCEFLTWQTKKRSFFGSNCDWVHVTIRNAKELGESQMKVVKQSGSLDCTQRRFSSSGIAKVYCIL